MFTLLIMMVGTTAKVWILLLTSLFPALTQASKLTQAAGIIRTFKSTLPENCQSLSGKKKIDILWENCLEDTTGVGHVSQLEASVTLLRNMNDTFDHAFDARPWKRKKPIHSTGPAALRKPNAKFDADPFTLYAGIFKGCSNVLLRFASGVNQSPESCSLVCLPRSFAMACLLVICLH